MAEAATQAAAAGTQSSCPDKATSAVIRLLEKFFYWLGYGVASHPVPVILACIVFTAACGTGLSRFREESDPEKLFVPKKTQVLDDSAWIDDHFPGLSRFENVIITADDILQPEVIKSMLAIDSALKNVSSIDPLYSWESLCYKLGTVCWSNSILELWSYDEAIISNLTRRNILDTINTVTVSPVTSAPFPLDNYLGEISRDGSGNITSAKAASLRYVLFNNDTNTIDGPLTTLGMAFESDFVVVAADKAEVHADVIKDVFYFVQRSQTDEGGTAIQGDLALFIGGYVLLVVFVALTLGQFSMVYHRAWVTLGGIVCVLLAIVVALGLASWAGIFYGPLHNVLPFLVLGLGVDDMFIITQALENLPVQQWRAPIRERLAHALSHAGVSVTVTSFTDIVAFGVGATTAIPALSSFCIYACIAIFAVYVFQATLFVAVLSIDESRADQARDACCCCVFHRHYQPLACSQTSYMQLFFDRVLARLLQNTFVKVHVLLVTLLLLAASIVGVCYLRQDFDPAWFIPSDSYAAKYLDAKDRYFPSDGVAVVLYLGKVDYYGDFDTVAQLCEDMAVDPYTLPGSVDCWATAYNNWLENTNSTPLTNATYGFPVNETQFYQLLQVFLSNPAGTRFRSNTFLYNITDGVYYIQACKIPGKHVDLASAAEEIQAMDSLRSVAANSSLEGFPYSFYYGVWEGNRVIRMELYRNLGLALICVLAMTVLLLANIWACLLIATCVIFTLLNVAGSLYFWGLTIDTVTSINLVLAVGLAVDYSAHIALAFMTVKGNNDARMMRTIGLVGPAVFYGGFSTFLAFVILVSSTSYVFQVFFKVFLCVTLFGLFHGLVYLPVVLSLVGPRPYLNAAEEEEGGEQSHPRYSTRTPTSGFEPRSRKNNTRFKTGRTPVTNGVSDNRWHLPRPTTMSYSNDHNGGSFRVSGFDSFPSKGWVNSHAVNRPMYGPQSHAQSRRHAQTLPQGHHQRSYQGGSHGRFQGEYPGNSQGQLRAQYQRQSQWSAHAQHQGYSQGQPRGQSRGNFAKRGMASVWTT